MKRLLSSILFAVAVLVTPALAQETRTFTDDAGRTVEIPVAPKRIVSLHDLSLTVPLIELGVMPIGSHGRTTEQGVPFIRSSKVLTGVDFDNSEIQFVGNLPADVEAVAALEPDIILTTAWQTADVEQLQAIAPTVVLDDTVREPFAIFEVLSDLTGTQDRLAILKTRYDGQIEQIRRLIEPGSVSASVIQANDGKLYIEHTYGALGKVMRDAGFTFPDRVEAIAANQSAEFSAETMPEFDADFVFATYRTDALQTPEDARDALEAALPNFCEFLHACRENQLIIIPREEASAASFYGLGVLTYMLISQISGRDFVPLPR
ncbi:iron complex transport system substrate-binding protein [Devosia lucknowensis]|uniref:Iron complex transport system substrate-binding protein n=1 Tax=Devosia lucknowensis TaxID=1096929 RepID=A0A1Y6G6K3_9HYPH|nr:ABC transporter substrate-binding protein [Devosia lucknowensis]SMQ85404.1 iron complex transport system substrate-binding protein [Devosia lucknowensis]